MKEGRKRVRTDVARARIRKGNGEGRRRTEHVERLEIHQTGDQVKTIGSSERDDDVPERRVVGDEVAGKGREE